MPILDLISIARLLTRHYTFQIGKESLRFKPLTPPWHTLTYKWKTTVYKHLLRNVLLQWNIFFKIWGNHKPPAVITNWGEIIDPVQNSSGTIKISVSL